MPRVETALKLTDKQKEKIKELLDELQKKAKKNLEDALAATARVQGAGRGDSITRN